MRARQLLTTGVWFLAASCAGRALAVCEPQWIPTGGVSGVDGTVQVMTAWDPDGAGGQPERVVVGGSFSLAGSVQASNIACWNPASQTWAALGSGMDGWIYALAALDGRLYVGGYFVNAGGITVNGLACWDPTTQTWTAVGDGLGTSNSSVPATVTALAALDGRLYVAGAFTAAGGVSAASIACWDPATSTWSALGGGIAGTVHTLAGLDGKLYAGGEFSTVGTVSSLDDLACWDPATSTWSGLGTGVGGVEYPCVWALAALDGKLYVAGDFTTADGSPVNHLASWDPAMQTWAAVGDEATPVGALAVGDGKLYAMPVACQGEIISWDPATSTWSAVAGDLQGGTAYSSVALAVVDCKLYAGSDFTTAGEVKATGIACWDLVASGWSALGAGMDGPVLAMTALDGRMYVGGKFTNVGGLAVNQIACWDPTTLSWSALGSGLDGIHARVLALTTLGDKLYAGGWFRTVSGVYANGVACWDPAVSEWTGLMAGVEGHSREVAALAALGDRLYAAGNFTGAGDQNASNIACWNPATATWSALGAGTDSGVNILAALNGKLYAGGYFTTAGGVNARGIACWDPAAQAWSPLVGELSTGNPYTLPFVRALAALDGKLYVAGYFTIAGGVSAKNIACWDPATSLWSALGTGIDEDVHALTVFDGRLYAGGWFAAAGGATADSIAYWDPLTQVWSPVGTGTDESVQALAVLDDTLYAGGHFTIAGGQVAAYWARARRAVPSVPLDFDGDCSVGPSDLAVFIACATGPTIPYDPDALPTGCSLEPDDQGIIAADRDGDRDVDQSDFGRFQRCWSGFLPAVPGCGDEPQN